MSGKDPGSSIAAAETHGEGFRNVGPVVYFGILGAIREHFGSLTYP